MLLISEGTNFCLTENPGYGKQAIDVFWQYFTLHYSYFVPLLEELVVTVMVSRKGMFFFYLGGRDHRYIFFLSSYMRIGTLSTICQVLTAAHAK